MPALIWLTECQEVKARPLRFFDRFDFHRKQAGGEAAAAGDVYFPGGWYADIRELSGGLRRGPVRIFLIHRGPVLTLGSGVVLRRGVL